MALEMLISWVGAVGFCVFVSAFIIALIRPRSALSEEDSAKIRKLAWKEDE